MPLRLPSAETLGVVPGEANFVGGLGDRHSTERCVGYCESLQIVADSAVIERAVKVSRGSERAADKTGRRLLDYLVGGRVVMAHVAGIEQVDLPLLAGTNEQIGVGGITGRGR